MLPQSRRQSQKIIDACSCAALIDVRTIRLAVGVSKHSAYLLDDERDWGWDRKLVNDEWLSNPIAALHFYAERPSNPLHLNETVAVLAVIFSHAAVEHPVLASQQSVEGIIQSSQRDAVLRETRRLTHVDTILLERKK